MKKKKDTELYNDIWGLIEEANPELKNSDLKSDAKKTDSKKSHLKVVHKKKK